MNTEIQRFDFKGAALRTLTDENGEPWFVAKDVCDVLEISNVSQALARRIDDDEKSSITLNDGTPGNRTGQSSPNPASTLSSSHPASRRPTSSNAG